MVWQALGAIAGSLIPGLFGSSGSSSNSAYMSLKDQKSLAKYESALNWQYASKGTKVTEALNKRLMDYQYELERKSRQNSFVDTRKDLESAGYNPLLAIGSQSNYVPVSSGVQGASQDVESSGVGLDRSSAISNLVNSAVSGTGAYNQTRMTSSDIASSLYKNAETSANTEFIRSRTVGQDIQNAVDNVFKMKQGAADLNLTKAQTRSVNTSVSRMLKEIEHMSSQINLNQQYSAESRSRQNLNNLTSAIQEHQARYHKNHPKLSQFSYGVKHLLTGSSNGSNPVGNVVNLIPYLIK